MITECFLQVIRERGKGGNIGGEPNPHAVADAASLDPRVDP